jgi:hypothetical protein
MTITAWNARGFALAATAVTVTAAALGAAACGPAAASAGTSSAGTSSAGTSSAGTSQVSGVKTPGWRVVQTIGPAKSSVSGLLTADSARDAWSVWTGAGPALVERWTGTAWTRVPLPGKLDADAASAVALGASSASDFWLFDSHRTTAALRWTGGTWRLQPVPSWVLRRDSAGTVTATAAVFSPRNVWVFSLGAGAYAARYDGRTWTRVKLPEVPLDVSAVAPDDIWALGPSISSVMHWNGKKWATVGLPLLPLPKGATVSYSNLTATGPKDAWLFRSISFPSGPIPVTAVMHWNGTSWLTVAGPADIVGSMAPDGNGGLWADGIDINPGGFWLLYHLVGSHWTEYTPPGVDTHSPTPLTQIPGTRSLWATGSAFTAKGYYGVLLKYGP